MRAHSAWMASRRGEACERQAARGMMGKEISTRQGMDVKIEDEIKRIRDTFGPMRERDSRNVPFTCLIRLFDAVEKHLNGVTENKIALHILSVVKKIKKTVGTLLKKTEINKIGNANYAQAACWGVAAPKIEHPQAVKPPKENPIKEKQLLIRIIDTTEAEAIYKLFIRALVERITVNINNGQRASGVIVAHQLPNRDVQVHLVSQKNKRRLKREINWTGNLRTMIIIKKKIYKVLIYDI